MNLNSVQLMAIEYTILAMALFLTVRSVSLRKDNMNHFMQFIIVTDLFAIVNIPIRFIELHLVSWNRDFVFWLYAISILLMTGTVICWFIFSLKQLNSKLVSTRTRTYLCVIPALFIIPLCIINYWTGWLYVIDESSWYVRGSHFVLQAAVSYAYLLVVITCHIKSFIEAEDKDKAKRFFFAAIPVGIGSLLQIYFGGSYLLLGIVFCGWIMYVEVGLDRQKAYEISEAVRTQEIYDIIEREKKLEEAKIYETHALEMKELFLQTIEAMVSAIDAKDNYTRGHSVRVAKYSRQIAELAGKNETECEQVYYAGLLHDVGKIGISDSIICKEGRLTDEEYNAIKKHPSLGNDILQRINKMPYLSIGANSHHERYDGKGYPSGLTGENIPELARIIAVADAYDAMTSKRSYRNTIPQQTVREELIKGMGTQFDAEFAKIMVHLIDLDIEYDMQEHHKFDEEDKAKELSFEEYRANHSNGMRITDTKCRIHFNYKKTTNDGMPSFVLYDSGDARVHKGDKLEKQLSYYEYGEIKLDGSYILEGIRAYDIDSSDIDIADDECSIELVKDNDHIYFEMKSAGKLTKGTLALPDNTRYVYICITGVDCVVSNINDVRDDKPIQEGSIKRIVDPITYLSGKEGNIPSIQVDGYRTAATQGILFNKNAAINFEMKSLPFAERIWHCPYIIIYNSGNGQLYGTKYKEYGVVRFNGESWGEVEGLSNNIAVKKDETFPGWDQWKDDNKIGRKCQVTIKKIGNTVVTNTICGGIVIENTTEVESGKKLYVAISGDQCVIEDINVVTE